MAGFWIALADPSFAVDRVLVGAVTCLINEGLADSERGLWVPGSERVSAELVKSFVAGGELVLVRHQGLIAGVARVRFLSASEAECTLVVRDPRFRGRRIGSDLLAFAGQWAAGLGAARIRAELLTPRAPANPARKFLCGWLERHGYRHVGTGDLADWPPAVRSRLATAGDNLVFYRSL